MSRRDPELESPYREALEGLLSFASFEAAEATLRRLEEARGRYRDAQDSKGIEQCRAVGRRGRRRAEGIARNPRVETGNRLRKQEIAHWFAIWLENPAIFYDWLELRKRTPEFQKLLQSEAARPPG